jgi:4-hydroxy-tetrahydrodipicolinate synthase
MSGIMSTRRTFLASAGFLPASLAGAASSKLPEAAHPQFIIAALTMLNASGKLDGGLNRDYLAYLAAGGADGVLVMGTTGEFASFSIKERKQALESTLQHKGKLSVMCQIGASNLPETLDLLEHAHGAGADSVLVLPPYYFKNVPIDGVAAFFEPVLKAAKLPVLVYNIPQLSGVPITAELLKRLSGYERLFGMKDSFSKVQPMVEFLRGFPKLRLLTGVHGNIAANLKNNGAGALTGNGSIFLKETRAVFEARRSGADIDAAQAKLDSASTALSGYAGVPAMKFALSKRGLGESGVRPPFVPLTAAQRSDLAARLG